MATMATTDSETTNVCITQHSTSMPNELFADTQLTANNADPPYCC
jgi:hypothetical protein